MILSFKINLAANAVCLDAACTSYKCQDGYTGIATVACNDIDECTGTPPAAQCPANSVCQNSSGSYSCIRDTGYKKNNTDHCEALPCPPGYFGTMPTGCNSLIVGGISLPGGGWGCKEGYELGTDQCIDIDECAQGVNGTDACHSSAECLNIVGTYKCTCINGYFGNGKTECRLKPCPAGKMGSGLRCKYIPSHAVLVPGGTPPTGWLVNEKNFVFNIATGNRYRNTICQSAAPGCGPYEGTTYNCLSGFLKVVTAWSESCDDIDECAPGGTANCHLNANCVNNKGSFDCFCKVGYLGDGVTYCDKLGCPNDQFGIPPNPCKVIYQAALLHYTKRKFYDFDFSCASGSQHKIIHAMPKSGNLP